MGVQKVFKHTCNRTCKDPLDFLNSCRYSKFTGKQVVEKTQNNTFDKFWISLYSFIFFGMVLYPVLLSSFICYFLAMLPFIRYLFNKLSTICIYLDSRSSVAGIATGLWATRSGVRIPVGQRNPSLLHKVHTATLGPTQPPTK
jgi:hypothetical protein